MDTISGILLILLLMVFILINSKPQNKGQNQKPGAPAAKPASAPPAAQSKPAQPATAAPPPRPSVKRFNDFVVAVLVGVISTFALQLFTRSGNPDNAILAQQAGNLSGSSFWIASVAIAIIVFALLSRNVR